MCVGITPVGKAQAPSLQAGFPKRDSPGKWRERLSRYGAAAAVTARSPMRLRPGSSAGVDGRGLHPAAIRGKSPRSRRRGRVAEGNGLLNRHTL